MHYVSCIKVKSKLKIYFTNINGLKLIIVRKYNTQPILANKLIKKLKYQNRNINASNNFIIFMF